MVSIDVNETHYCHIHGEYRGQGCPDCREDREKAEGRAEERFYEAQEDAERRAAESANQFANPGDYKCPFCRFKTLLMDASRCPKCHGVVPESYWVEVEARKKANAAQEAERRAREEARKAKKREEEREEWIRKEPERRAAAATQAAKEACEASNRKRRKWGWGILLALLFASGLAFHDFVTKYQALQTRLMTALKTAKVIEQHPGETVSVFAPVGEEWIKLCKPAHFLLPAGVQYYTGFFDVLHGSILPINVTNQGADAYFTNHEPSFAIVDCYYLRSLGDAPLEIKVRFPK